MELYPLKFTPLLQERIWGGRELGTVLHKNLPEGKIGESWELSGVPGYQSVVSNGPLKGHELGKLIETYKGVLVGEDVWKKYGAQFPILIKFIDAQDDLSIQVHPDDELAMKRHSSMGKTEMWYVVDAAPGAFLYVGFNRSVSREEYLDAVASGTLPSLLKKEPVKPGDTFFIPAGTIHAIGKGCLIAEIQETSDITYRVDDWGRVDEKGNPRQLHTEQAVDSIDFGAPRNLNITRTEQSGKAVELASSPWFTTNIVRVDGLYGHKLTGDTPIIYMCLDGEATIIAGTHNTAAETPKPETLKKGETVLIPANAKEIELNGRAKVLEVYL